MDIWTNVQEYDEKASKECTEEEKEALALTPKNVRSHLHIILLEIEKLENKIKTKKDQDALARTQKLYIA